MTKEKAKQLLDVVMELKKIKKILKGYQILEAKEMIIDTDLEAYLKGVCDAE